MAFAIIGGRSRFWQWDVGQKLVVYDDTCGQVHFCNGTTECALVTTIYTLEDGTRVADVPDIILQTAKPFTAYLYHIDGDSRETMRSYRFEVAARSKPEGYVYVKPEGDVSGGGGLNWLAPEAGEAFTSIAPAPTRTGISAAYTGGDVVIGTALSALVGIVVTASYSDGTTATVTDYTLSGSIAEGSNTITVTYEDMTTTFTVTGVEELPEVVLTGITATYVGGNVAVGTALTALTGVTVTAHYSDGSTAPVTGYILSGEIVEGSNTITVSYGGKTTTFTVTGEAAAEPVEYPVYLETIDGVEYICTTDPALVVGQASVTWLKANSYKNDNYTCFSMQANGYNGQFDNTVAEPYGGVIPFAEGTNETGAVLLNYAEDGDFCGGPGKGWFRLPTDLGGHETAEDYYWEKYGVLKMALYSTANRKTIDPSLITSISIKQNDDTWQYAQFGYSDGPAENIYRGFNTLTFQTGSNANLSASTRPFAAMTTTTLSIKFYPGTFKDFTLDAVKAFLTAHPLTFIYV